MLPSQYAHALEKLWMRILSRSERAAAPARILRVGIDIMDVKRFRGPRGKATASGLLTEAERRHCESLVDPPREWASLWAAREAVYKAASGLIDVLPQSWCMIPVAKGEWRPAPRRDVACWRAFEKGHRIELVMHADDEHAMALAAIWKRMNPQ